MNSDQIRLLLIRHGATPWNDEQRIIGRTDLPLSERGVDQARRVAARLRTQCATGQSIQGLYTSPLKRAVDTAEEIAAACKRPYRVDSRLRETDLGVWEGLTLEAAMRRYATEVTRWQHDPTAAPTGGEAPNALQARTREFMYHLHKTHSGQTVALVGHGGMFQALLFMALDLPYRNDWVFYLYNGSLSELWLRAPRNVAVYLNDTAHLHDSESSR